MNNFTLPLFDLNNELHDLTVMVFDISEEELFILKTMCQWRNFTSKRSCHPKRLEKVFLKKEFESSFDDTMRSLQNRGLVGKVAKKPYKYYIGNSGDVLRILGEHGIDIPKGGVRKL